MRHRTWLQNELTKEVGMDIMEWIRRKQRAGLTYRRMAILLSPPPHAQISPNTLKRWVSYERNGR